MPLSNKTRTLATLLLATLPLSASAGPVLKAKPVVEPGVKQSALQKCTGVRDAARSRLIGAGERHYYDSNATLLVDAGARAGKSGLTFASADTLFGEMELRNPDGGDAKKVHYSIEGSGETLSISWSFGGANFVAPVDSCDGAIWTASAANSVIAIRLGSLEFVGG